MIDPRYRAILEHAKEIFHRIHGVTQDKAAPLLRMQDTFCARHWHHFPYHSALLPTADIDGIVSTIMYHHQQNKLYSKAVYLPITKLHSILAIAYLFAHNNIIKLNLLLRSNFSTECCS